MKRTLKLGIGLFFICLALVAIHEMLVISGLFEKKNNVPETGQTSTDNNLNTEPATLTWNTVSRVKYYNVYWSNSPGVTKGNGTKISSETNSVTINGLKPGDTYYFVVTAVNEFGESEESEVLSYPVRK